MKRLVPAALAIALATAFALPAAARVGSLARITVVDRTDNRELPVHWRDGRAYIAGQPGREYRIRVRNTAGEDLLAVVSVDGVNVVSGETASASQSGYVVGPHASLDIDGWRKSLRDTAAFYFTTLPDSYAARTGRPDDVGVIGVALFRRKPPEPVAYAPSRPLPLAKGETAGSAAPAAPAPAQASAERMEPRESASKRATADTPLGTGHGRLERNGAHWVAFERATPYPAETIAIQYDSHRNLVAQGIIRATPRPRDPNPFPGFVPDPVSWLPRGHRPAA